jgi:hypothetical protein
LVSVLGTDFYAGADFLTSATVCFWTGALVGFVSSAGFGVAFTFSSYFGFGASLPFFLLFSSFLTSLGCYSGAGLVSSTTYCFFYFFSAFFSTTGYYWTYSSLTGATYLVASFFSCFFCLIYVSTSLSEPLEWSSRESFLSLCLLSSLVALVRWPVTSNSNPSFDEGNGVALRLE